MIRFKMLYDVRAMTMAERRIFNVWKSMRQRCSNPKSQVWDRYGGRGIKVCERWDKSFMDFVADVGIPADPTVELDRVDNDKGYEPGNTRWVSHRDNLLNYSKNHVLDIEGVRKTASEWADEAGIDRVTFHCRFKAGWRGRALLKPARKMQPVTIDGVTKQPHEWAKAVGMTLVGFVARLKNGVTGRDLLKPSQKSKTP
jgi:hypothetical protein